MRYKMFLYIVDHIFKCYVVNFLRQVHSNTLQKHYSKKHQKGVKMLRTQKVLR